MWLQRAVCDVYGIIINVVTSDQLNWCVETFSTRNALLPNDSWMVLMSEEDFYSQVDSPSSDGAQVSALHAKDAEACEGALPHIHLTGPLQYHQVALLPPSHLSLLCNYSAD